MLTAYMIDATDVKLLKSHVMEICSTLIVQCFYNMYYISKCYKPSVHLTIERVVGIVRIPGGNIICAVPYPWRHSPQSLVRKHADHTEAMR